MPEPITSAPDAAPPGVLIIDDEPCLPGLLSLVLTREGYAVWTAGSGQAGLDLYRRHHDRIAVVLLDVCMPGLDGPRTLAEMRRIDPGVVACFMSGDAGRYPPETLAGAGAADLFEKPFCFPRMIERLGQLTAGVRRRSA